MVFWAQSIESRWEAFGLGTCKDQRIFIGSSWSGWRKELHVNPNEQLKSEHGGRMKARSPQTRSRSYELGKSLPFEATRRFHIRRAL